MSPTCSSWRRTLTGVALALLTSSAVSGCARRDLTGLCKLAQDILAEPRIEPAQRFTRFAAQTGGFAFAPRTRELLAELEALPPAARWERLSAHAKAEVGESWSCPALRAVISGPP